MFRLTTILLSLLMAVCGLSQDLTSLQDQMSADNWQLYPYTYADKPDIASPFTFNDNTEIVMVVTKDNRFGIVPVTVENGEPLLYSSKIKSLLGKDRQLDVDAGDFPVLAATGLHDEASLKMKEMITGYPVSIITSIGRPDGFSTAGFMAEDEDIISVLIGDNRLVQKMGLTHPQMAIPIFHCWNLVLKEMESGYWERHYDHIKSILYNQNSVSFYAHGTKGWQVSIFQDEIQGSCEIRVGRDLTSAEKAYLDKQYPDLKGSQRMELEKKISFLNFSEMNPFYIMRYGFYEGHTHYRCDPIAIAFIFGLKTLEELDIYFEHDLYHVLTNHWVAK